MWKDEVDFVMMPFYVKTRKKDVTTWNYVFPFFHLRRGDYNLNGWQLWPLIGQEEKDVGMATDVWGDEFVSPGHSKEFYLWPIGLHQKTGIGTENPSEFYGVLPFYAQTRSPNRDHSVILWPLFNWADDREKKYREWGMPYPFFVFARGEGKTTDGCSRFSASRTVLIRSAISSSGPPGRRRSTTETMFTASANAFSITFTRMSRRNTRHTMKNTGAPICGRSLPPGSIRRIITG
jgi:hypothetical protein